MTYADYLWLDAPLSAVVAIGALFMLRRRGIGRGTAMVGRALAGVAAALAVVGVLGTLPIPLLFSLRWIAVEGWIAPLVGLVLSFAALLAASVTTRNGRGRNALTISALRRRSPLAVGPRFLVTAWLSTSLLTIAVLILCGIVTETGSGRSMLRVDFGSVFVRVEFPGWASSWPLLVTTAFQIAVGWAVLWWNAQRPDHRMGVTPQLDQRRGFAGLVLIVYWSSSLWALASLLDEVGRAGFGTLGSEDVGIEAASPLAVLAPLLLVIASIGRGIVVALLVRQAVGVVRNEGVGDDRSARTVQRRATGTTA